MNYLFFDESGASGILDLIEQPVFTLSAVNITEEEAVRVCKGTLPHCFSSIGKSKELKLKRLLQSDDAAFASEIIALHERVLSSCFVRSFAVEKRFCLLCMIAMNCIPAEWHLHNHYAELALDLRLRWSQLSLMTDMDGLLKAYYDAISRSELDQHSRRFFSAFAFFAKKVIDETSDRTLREVVGGIAECRPDCVAEFEESVGKTDMVAMSISGILEQALLHVDTPLHLTFDKSCHDDRTFEIIKLLTANREGISFSSINSKLSFGVQLADILAGSSRLAAEWIYGYAAENDIHSDFRKSIANLYKTHDCMMFNLTNRPPTLAERSSGLLNTFGAQ